MPLDQSSSAIGTWIPNPDATNRLSLSPAIVILTASVIALQTIQVAAPSVERNLMRRIETVLIFLFVAILFSAFLYASFILGHLLAPIPF